jgi:gluconokinase
MGVSGSGKSTVGRRVAQTVGITFFEGDDFHPAANVAKMAAGIPLEDVDRLEWIAALMLAVNASTTANVIVACSALTCTVRTRIAARSLRPVLFLYLKADPEVIAQRLVNRGPHFMKPGMLPSQLAALEEPQHAMVIDASRPLHEVCAVVSAEVRKRLS